MIEHARAELEVARCLADGGYAAQSVSRAYYAAFYAAEAALVALGETRSKHSGVLSAFGELVVRTGDVDLESGRALRSLFDRRNGADYYHAEFSDQDAADAIGDAEHVVAAIESWLSSS